MVVFADAIANTEMPSAPQGSTLDQESISFIDVHSTIGGIIGANSDDGYHRARAQGFRPKTPFFTGFGVYLEKEGETIENCYFGIVKGWENLPTNPFDLNNYIVCGIVEPTSMPANSERYVSFVLDEPVELEPEAEYFIVGFSEQVDENETNRWRWHLYEVDVYERGGPYSWWDGPWSKWDELPYYRSELLFFTWSQKEPRDWRWIAIGAGFVILSLATIRRIMKKRKGK